MSAQALVFDPTRDHVILPSGQRFSNSVERITVNTNSFSRRLGSFMCKLVNFVSLGIFSATFFTAPAAFY